MTKTTTTADRPVSATGKRAWTRAATVLVMAYLAVAIPLILLLDPRGRPGEDQINFHEPAVREFARQLPTPDLSDYLSATTPGYHLLVAAGARLLSPETHVLQFMGAIFTVALLTLLAHTVGRSSRGSWVEWLVLCLPFACSMHVLHAGVWILPDNAGWLFVLACLALAFRDRFDRSTVVLGGLALLGLVMVRQVHIWAAGVLWLAAWLAPGLEAPGGPREFFARRPARVRSLAPMLLASLPAFLLLAYFLSLWGGLTPPTFQRQYHGANYASFAFTLSLLGIGSVFFVGYFIDPLVDLLASRRRQVILAGLAGAAVAIIPPTTYGFVEGRISGLWNLAAVLPSVAGHTSPVIVIFSSLGAVMLLVWTRALDARDRWIALGAFAAFATAQTFSFHLWQRYHEPFILMMLALMAARSRRPGSTWPFTDRLLAPVRIGAVAAFGLLLAGLSAYSIYRSKPAVLYDLDKINLPAKP